MYQEKGETHGTIYFDPETREFIQVRETYFDPDKLKNPEEYLSTGHFAKYLGDAKNNVPMKCLKVKDLKRLINIEVVGLKNIPNVRYNSDNHEWMGVERSRCRECGQLIRGS